MSDEITIAGLSKGEANKRLYAALKERLAGDVCRYPQPNRAYFFTKLRPYDHFTESHDSIHLLLDSMSDAEKGDYARYVDEMSRSPVQWAAFATRAEKCEIALIVLGLEAQ